MLVDVDNDSTLDLLAKDGNGDIVFFQNTGSARNPVFTEKTGVSNPYNGINVDMNGAPILVDMGLVAVVKGDSNLLNLL